LGTDDEQGEALMRISRRKVIAGMAATPITTTAGTTTDDAELNALGDQFADIVRALDACAWNDDELESRLHKIEAAIVNTQATTTEGMLVKARIACWSRIGDLGPAGSTVEHRMGLSIVRDLIRLNDPGLERPGALAELARHDNGQ
jgi:hypothetical protein